MQPNYSVVVPVYNSQDSLQELYQKIKDFFLLEKKRFEVIFVDDSSKDNSWEVLRQIKINNPSHQISIFKLSKNVGQQKATLCGIIQSSNSFIITIDDDLQTDPFDIRLLIEKQNETNADLVYGVYERKQHFFLKNLGSHFINWFFHKFSSTYHSGSSFRLINKEIINNLKPTYYKHLLIDEILCAQTDHITHTKVCHYSRNSGSSNYTTLKLVLLTINYIINYTVIPLRLMTYIGLFFSIITFSLGLYFIYQKLFSFVELGFTSLIVAISFSTSIILFALGIIGEYLMRIYSKSDAQPVFVIKESIK